MSLNPDFSALDASSPSAKLTININAFNGNTTNFGPRPKLLIPIQPRQPRQPRQPLQEVPSFSQKPSPGLIMPL